MSLSFESLLAWVRAEQPDICVDSRLVTPGSVFVAVPGVASDGARFIPAAVRAGAAAVVCRHDCAEGRAAAASGMRVFTWEDPRAAVWMLARARYHTDRLPMRILGVTGTNGKTTTTYLLEHVLNAIGCRVGVMGTVSYRWPGHEEEASLTTPDSLRVHRMLADMAVAGVDVAIMEVSSHALEQQRVGGVAFDGAAFSNLTQDHLDFHQDMESYFRAKARLFVEVPHLDKAAVVNADDAWGRRLLKLCPKALSFGLGEGLPGRRHLAGRIMSSSTAGLHLGMTLEGRQWEIRSPLVGGFNASNLLAVQALCLELGVDPADFRHFEDFYGVSGRLERIPNEQGLDVFVDYAHTPDALVNVLKALRDAGFQRIITVFGCGGNRDRTKRPRMGEAVAAWSDVAVLTSDNPRHEAPEAIMADVLPGLKEARQLVVEADRRKATQAGLALLRPGDALLVAGKGHESYQQIGAVKYPYSDQQTLRELLRCA